MCGICGVYNPQQPIDEAVLQAMCDVIHHRGPDNAGVWSDPTAGIGFGFRRLAILDLSPTGDQPMHSADGRFVVVFNGEIYNYRDLRAELEQRGVRFRGTSDTEVILEGASLWGAKATIPRLWGMFAIALWDRQERTLLLARDRIGKKPLYYTQMDGVLLFGSELKALHVHPAFRAEIDRDALALYFRYGYIPTPYSIYKNVSKLLQGHYAIVHASHPPELHTYWSARQVAENGLAHRLRLPDEEAIAQLDTLLRDAVARRMIADVPLGAFLSGGIDSSTVVALMQAQSSIPVRTFSIGFYIEGYNEAEEAKAVAQHLKTDHTELYVTPEEAWAVIPRLPDLYDEPFADSSQIPTFLVAQLARQHVTVSLSGDGGDELFGGYNRYAWADTIWNRTRYVPFPIQRLVASAIQQVPTTRWDTLYQGVESWLPHQWRHRLPGDKLHKLAGVLDVHDQSGLYRNLVSIWKTPAALVSSGTEPPTLLLDPSLRESFPDFTERMMFLDLVTYLPDDILVKVDRASMGISLEARNPLLDHRVVEWVWQLPLRLKRRNDQSKWLLRQVLYRYVPPQLIERPKMGFGIPIDVWLCGPLREWAEELLNERRLRREGLLHPEPIRQAWTEHLAGHRNNQYHLWTILMFQSWRERWQPRL